MMQFPTCKAPVRKDGVRISSLFDEFAVAKFTGYCKIQLGREEHILALKEGDYILAESGSLKGTDAFKFISDLGTSTAEVILCPLSLKQFQVTLLFNAPYRIIAAEEPGHPMAEAERDMAREFTQQEIREPVGRGKGSAPVTQIHPVSIPSTVGKSHRVRSIKITAESEDADRKKKPIQVIKPGEKGRVARKINQLTLESIKELKETFTLDAADLLRELHMEHLIQPDERDSRKSNSENR
jgi:hypothetical protein